MHIQSLKILSAKINKTRIFLSVSLFHLHLGATSIVASEEFPQKISPKEKIYSKCEDFKVMRVRGLEGCLKF